MNRPATAQAFYRQGELHRLRGETDAAERAYEYTKERIIRGDLAGAERQDGVLTLTFRRKEGA